MHTGRIVVELILWPIMLIGLVINVILLREIAYTASLSSGGAAQSDMAMQLMVSTAGLPVMLVSGVLAAAIYLSQKDGGGIVTTLKYGHGLGSIAIFNSVFSLVVFSLTGV